MSAPSENIADGRDRDPRETAAGCGTCRILSAAPFSWCSPRTLQFDGYVHNILMQATTFAIAVFGLSVVLGLCGQINLAQAAFFGLGAYAVGLGTADYHLSYWLCLAGGCVIALLAGAFLGMSTLRLGGHYLAMVTISFQQIVTLVMINSIWLTHGPGRRLAASAGPTCFSPRSPISPSASRCWRSSAMSSGISPTRGLAARCARCATTNSRPASSASTCSAPRCSAFAL